MKERGCTFKEAREFLTNAQELATNAKIIAQNDKVYNMEEAKKKVGAQKAPADSKQYYIYGVDS